MSTEDFVVITNDLLALEFPAEETGEWERNSGPEHHLHVLQASQDFWEDRTTEAWEAADKEIGVALRDLADVFTARWGQPETIELEPYLWSEDSVAGPIGILCQCSGELLAWRCAREGRWVGLAASQADTELPIELVVVIGTEPIPAV